MFIYFKTHSPLFHVLLVFSWSSSFPHCSCVPCSSEAGKRCQRDMNNQTSYLPELKADVGICICPGPFLYLNCIPPPVISEQRPVDHKHLKDEAVAKPGLPAECQNNLADTGVTTRNLRLPPFYISANLGFI